MTKSEKIYTALVAIWALLMIVPCIILLTNVIPRLEDPRPLRMVVGIIGFDVLVLGVTTGVAIAKDRLLLIPTLIQIVFLVFSGYGIPIAIFGIVLLRRSQKDEDQSPACEGAAGDSSEAASTAPE
jgi:hypothetical protein